MKGRGAGERSDLTPCPVDGCPKRKRISLLMCLAHWRMVPTHLQREVNRTWGIRLRNRRDPAAIDAHEVAKTAAIDHVNNLLKGGKP
jgi:hypothetical protein